MREYLLFETLTPVRIIIIALAVSILFILIFVEDVVDLTVKVFHRFVPLKQLYVMVMAAVFFIFQAVVLLCLVGHALVMFCMFCCKRSLSKL